MKPRIIQLEPTDETPMVVSYEEAFGEYSEARGRGRARRKARKLERIANRREVKAARREARQERKVGRQQVRQATKEARVAKRQAAQQARMGKRQAAMEARQTRRTDRSRMRQGRRTERKQMRQERRQIGDPTDQTPVEDGGASSEPETGGEQGGYTPPTPTQEQDNGGYTDTGVAPSPVVEEGEAEGQQEQPSPRPQQPVYQQDVTDYGNGGTGIYDDGSYAGSEDGGVEEESYDEESIDAETGASDEESGFTGELGFDGIIEMSEDDAIWNEYFSSVEGVATINPIVSDTARKIEQNKEAICLMQGKCNELAKTDPNAANRLQSQIYKRQTLLSNLENDLANYCKFDGDYSEARGGRKAVAKRKAEVRQAKKLARKERKAVRKNARKAKAAARRQARVSKRAVRKNERQLKRTARRNANLQKRNAKGLGLRRRQKTLTETELTQVDERLNPEFGEERIVIPAEEVANFAGNSNVQILPNNTGLIGLDAEGDYDAPEDRKYDLKFANASGDESKGKKVDFKSIAIGVGIGVLAIYLAKKYMK